MKKLFLSLLAMLLLVGCGVGGKEDYSSSPLSSDDLDYVLDQVEMYNNAVGEDYTLRYDADTNSYIFTVTNEDLMLELLSLETELVDLDWVEGFEYRVLESYTKLNLGLQLASDGTTIDIKYVNPKGIENDGLYYHISNFEVIHSIFVE